jgi:hypothetical protein
MRLFGVGLAVAIRDACQDARNLPMQQNAAITPSMQQSLQCSNHSINAAVTPMQQSLHQCNNHSINPAIAQSI